VKRSDLILRRNGLAEQQFTILETKVPTRTDLRPEITVKKRSNVF